MRGKAFRSGKLTFVEMRGTHFEEFFWKKTVQNLRALFVRKLLPKKKNGHYMPCPKICKRRDIMYMIVILMISEYALWSRIYVHFFFLGAVFGQKACADFELFFSKKTPQNEFHAFLQEKVNFPLLKAFPRISLSFFYNLQVLKAFHAFLQY